MALKKKKLKKKVVPKKKVLKKKVATKKKVVKKKAGKKKTGSGKFLYEPYREKKNIGNSAKNAILRGLNTDDIVAAVRDEFPDSNITYKSIAYYRNVLRHEGYDVPDPRG